MKRYRYSYQTIVRYDTLVSHHHFLLRSTPRISSQQRIVEQQLYLLSSVNVSAAKDAFGNDIRYGSMVDRHDMFVVASSGVVDCYEYRFEDHHPQTLFRSQTKMTAINHDMLLFNKEISAEGSPLNQALALSEAIHSYMKYQSGATSIETTAADAFKIKAGVCQDFAHLLISLCRERAILARYIVGFLVGTGETHAWVEVFSDGVWYGVDPTHNRVLEYGYIKVAQGRDAADCSVTRGVHRGGAGHTTEVHVEVEELEIV